ncbi:MAG TPA: tetratricopeptide repeat protein, partial [Gemmataceae bacterium]|nr:tetratricopeptide repeat protein [Gemmataceae bacterium]
MFRPVRATVRLVRLHPVRAGLAILTAALALAAGAQLWARSQLAAAERYVRAERLDEAEAGLRHCLLIWPRSADARRLAARVARLRGDYGRAEAELVECGRLQRPPDERTQLEWLLLRAQRGEIDEVAPSLWACAEREHPEADHILETLARGYMHQLRFRAALRCLDRRLARGPDTARVRDWRGWAREQLQDRDGALADYRAALEAEPGRRAVRLRLVALLLERDDAAGALPHLERLRGEPPADDEVRVGLARCRLLKGEHAEALALLDAVLAEHPDNLGALYFRGKALLDLGRAAEAEAALRRALLLKPAGPNILFALYRSLQSQRGRESETAECYARYRAAKGDLDKLYRLLGGEIERAPRDPGPPAEA